MDLAVRASLKGWKFVFLGDLMVKPQQFLYIHVTTIALVCIVLGVA